MDGVLVRDRRLGRRSDSPWTARGPPFDPGGREPSSRRLRRSTRLAGSVPPGQVDRRSRLRRVRGAARKSNIRNAPSGADPMRRNPFTALAVALLLAAPAAGVAQGAPMMSEVNPALFQGMEYRLVGPLQGGRVTTVTGVPSQPRTFYMGVASGGSSARRTAGRAGSPSPTARCRSARAARSRWPRPTRTSSTTGPAPTGCAATSPPGGASTRPPTAGRRGRSPGCATSARSAR